jgi:glycosyltransferase involved in cell wall biosynthesis
MTDKKENPTVSILVTVYNREAYLEQTLRSILASSFSDFEVVVVDDCSTDQSLKIAESIAKVDDRIRLIRNNENLGDYSNRKKAASLAKGVFLKYVDSDDLIYPHALQVMVDAMEKNPNTGFALSHSLPEDDEPYPWVLTPEESYRKHFLGRGCFGCGPSGAIIRKAAFDEVGGFRPEWRVLSDLDLWLRLAARWSCVLMPPGLVWWRRHGGQEFSTNNAHLIYLEKGFELAMATLDDAGCPLVGDERCFARDRARQHYARRLLAMATKGSSRTAWKLFRSSGLSLRELAAGLRRYK